MPTTTTRALRGTAFAALAMVGVLGLAACSGGAEEEPTTSETAAAEESTEPTTSEAPEETEASAEGGLCTAEQFGTLSAANPGSVSQATLDAATASFEPAAMIADLPATCLFTVQAEGQSVSYAVMPGGAATIATVSANATALGANVSGAEGSFSGLTADGGVVTGAPFTEITPETAGFENVEDLVVIATVLSAS